uniref:Reverse transcriptase domain-containing protein n=1 Tax=Leptobrachium leishanense TaxID=445787 RepID=A0A8C5R981_9ANUR
MANPRRKHQPITCLTTENSISVTSLDRNNGLFYDFFLARSQPPQDNVDLAKAFLEAYLAPRLPAHQREILVGPITDREVGGAITPLKTGKSPGPDGLTADYYKILKAQICPILTTMFNDIYVSGNAIDSFNASHTILIPKPGKPADNMSSYRPISLLNTDYKLLTKILASSLQTFLPDLLIYHQLGFVHGRHSVVGIRRAVAAVLGAHSASSGTHPTLLRLDLEQAFDSVTWSHLFRVLSRRSFGQTFTDFIRNITRYP